MTDTHTESFAEWQKAGAGCTSRAFKHPGRDVTRTWRLAVNFDWLHLWFRAGHRWWRSPSVRRSSMFPEGNYDIVTLNQPTPHPEMGWYECTT